MDLYLPADPTDFSAFQPANPSGPSTYKSFHQRVAAYILDMLICYAVIFAVAIGLAASAAVLGQLLGRPMTQTGNGESFAAGAASVAVFFLYFVIFEALFGATPGKAILRMRVVMEDGRPPSFWAALKRGILRFLVDGMFWGLPAYFTIRQSPMRQRLGDQWARTYVVDSRDPAIPVRRGGGRFVLACFAALIMFVGFVWSTLAFQFEPRVVPIVAADANLALEDVNRIAGGEFTLAEERGLAELDLEALDANLRVFEAEAAGAMSLIIVFPNNLVDDRGAMRTLLSDYIDAEVGSDAKAIKVPPNNTAFGNAGLVQSFSLQGAATTGTAVVFEAKNNFVRVMLYDLTGGPTDDRALALAQTLAARVGAE